MKPYSTAFALLTLFLGLAACSQGRQEPPKTQVEVVNAVPSYDTLSFLRVKHVEATLGYGNGAAFQFDADQYDFHFDFTPPATSTGQAVANFDKELVAGRDYFFVAAEVAGQVQPIVFDAPAFDAGSSDAQVLLVHADEQLGAVDVYLEPAGTDLSTATPLGKVGFEAHADPVTKTPGDYVLTVTAPQDPTTILYQSATALTLTAGDSNLLVLEPGPGSGLGDILATQDNSSTANVIVDTNAETAIRFVNAASDQANRDIYADKDFSAPLEPSVAYATASPYATLAAGDHDVAVTPVGNVSAIELENTLTLDRGTRYTYMVAGDSNGLSGLLVPQQNRPITQASRVQFLDGASQFAALNFYLEPAGTDITGLTPQTQLGAPGNSSAALFSPGDYELTLVDATDATTVLAGPTPVTLKAGGSYTVLAVNGSDSSTAQGIVFDDTP